MAFSFLTEENIFRRHQAAKKYTDALTEPFPEFARIARNRPSSTIDPNYPNTTDGTTASIIRKTPRRVIQQLPTGKVENDAEDWLSVVADFVLTKKLIPFANEEYDLTSKCWTFLEGGLTFGFEATYTPFLNHNGYFCPDVTGIYWGDIAIQPGKKSGYSCNYVFMRSWWQPEDIESLIDKETKLAKSAKERGEKYESTWDIKALKEIKDGGSTKDKEARTPMENERSVEANGIELITGFQTGVGAKFYTFSTGSRSIVRTEVNKDPRGKMPIDWLYGDVDGSNPLGRGIVELVGGLQNLIDSDMQMYQYNRALMLAPPLIKYGNVKNVKFVPNAVMDAGMDPNAKIVPLTVDTSAVINYPSLYGLQKSQLLNLVNSPDTSISAEVGNPGFSKTPAGINQQKATISVDDNYVRKMFEAWFENWCETAINLYFAKRSGIEELQLDDETADRLRKLASKDKFDISMLSDDNKIMIDYDTATPALKFRVDASTSKMNDDAEQLQALTGLLETVSNSPVLMQVIPPEKIIGIYNSIVTASAVEDPEDLVIDVEEFMAQQQQAQEQQMQQAQMAAQQPMPQLPQGELPQEQMQDAPQMPGQAMAPEQQQLDPEDAQLIEMLSNLGFSESVIAEAIDLLNQGANPDEVLQALGALQEGN